MILTPTIFDFVTFFFVKEEPAKYGQKTISIIGGTQYSTMKQIAKKEGLLLKFDNGKSPSETKYRKMANQSDSIVVMTGACSHQAMWLIKAIAKEVGKPVIFHKGRGVSGAIQLALDSMKEKEVVLQ